MSAFPRAAILAHPRAYKNSHGIVCRRAAASSPPLRHEAHHAPEIIAVCHRGRAHGRYGRKTDEAADSPHTFTANVGLYSQYVFRGLAQTNERPALQGGADYSHESGFYAGTWLSNASWFSDTNAGTSNSLEWDLYTGFRKSWDSGFSGDIGYLRYEYPGSYRCIACRHRRAAHG